MYVCGVAKCFRTRVIKTLSLVLNSEKTELEPKLSFGKIWIRVWQTQFSVLERVLRVGLMNSKRELHSCTVISKAFMLKETLKTHEELADDPQCCLMRTLHFYLHFHVSHADCSTANHMQPQPLTASQKRSSFTSFSADWFEITHWACYQEKSVPYGSILNFRIL